MTEQEVNKAREVPIHTVLNIKNTGRRIYIRCPFHNEKTPSCLIYADHGFKCQGCGEKGNNAIDFVMKLGFSFNEAVEELTKFI